MTSINVDSRVPKASDGDLLRQYLIERDLGAPSRVPVPESVDVVEAGAWRLVTLRWAYVQAFPPTGLPADVFVIYSETNLTDATTPDPVKSSIIVPSDARSHQFILPLSASLTTTFAIAAARLTHRGLERTPKAIAAAWVI